MHFKLEYAFILLFLKSVICEEEKISEELWPYYIGEKCWGYEKHCNKSFSSELIQCSEKEDIPIFFKEADFGYVQKNLDSLSTICKARSNREGNLECSNQLQFCRGRNIWVDFTDLFHRRNENLRYSSEILKHGQIKAKCEYDSIALKSEMIHMGVLQSWGAEMRNFHPFEKNEVIPCDLRIEKPTFVMKLDATVNMYHHFCDFFNLYASLHINGSSMPNSYDSFNRDVNILLWDNHPYRSAFASTFDAFTTNPILNLNDFAGKRVCFKNLVFPLLPRMLYGLFYNTPISRNDCQRSGLFKAFSDFIINRLSIPIYEKTNSKKIKVTILARQTRHRRILNLSKLEQILLEHGGFEVTIAPFTHTFNFKRQLEIIQNSDILVGIHGAGLTHMLFLPDWAVVFELFDCEDPSCYRDLAKFRGIKHISWTEMDKIYPEVKASSPNENPEVSAKFTNYAFDPPEFLKKIIEASDFVKNHAKFIEKEERKAFHSEL